MKTIAARTFKRLVRACQAWKCPRCGVGLSEGSLPSAQPCEKGRYPRLLQSSCACDAEHVFWLKDRRWNHLTAKKFVVDGTTWRAFFDGSAPRTVFIRVTDAGKPSLEHYVFDEIVEPSRFEGLIGFA